MRKILGILAVLFAATMIFTTSCQKDEVQNTEAQIVFDIHNPGLDNSNLKDGGVDDPDKPLCGDATPAYVMVTFANYNNGVAIKIPVLSSYDVTKTQVLKLMPGDYTVTSFEVYDANDNLIWVAPLSGSEYQQFLTNTLDLTITVDAFKKYQFDVDVLCWQDWAFEQFGYAWFHFNKYSVKTLCFFGDVCTKFYDAWHIDGSPYAGQVSGGEDFPAIITVTVYDHNTGAVMSNPNTFSNASYLGEGEPLCIEYVDNLEDDNDQFDVEISLVLPDGSVSLLTTLTIDADEWSGNGFGGNDGVYDFLVGGKDCIYGNDYDASFGLPWVPLPSTVEFTVLYPFADSYFGLGNITPSIEVGEFVTGDDLPAWCGNKDLHIYPNHRYLANVYPYFAIPAGNQYTSVAPEKWAILNWIANEAIGVYNKGDIQNAIWYILGYNSTANALATTAMTHTDYIAPLGGFIVVLVDPTNDLTTGGLVEGKAQLAIVRFDP